MGFSGKTINSPSFPIFQFPNIPTFQFCEIRNNMKDNDQIKSILEQIQNGSLTVEEAVKTLADPYPKKH